MWTKEESRRWKEHHASTCIDCGKKCSGPGVKRCKQCDNASRRTSPAPKFCPSCNKPINQNREYKTKRWAAKTCVSCASKRKWESGKMESNRRRGENSGAWKGGKFKNSGGYVLIYKPDHPRASKRRYVQEHILVWEEANGKPLPDGWIIHHLNGVKDDNRPSNLVALPGKQHYLVLAAKAKRIQELEALLNNQHQLL